MNLFETVKQIFRNIKLEADIKSLTKDDLEGLNSTSGVIIDGRYYILQNNNTYELSAVESIDGNTDSFYNTENVYDAIGMMIGGIVNKRVEDVTNTMYEYEKNKQELYK